MTKPIIHDGTEQREMTAAEHTEWKALVAEIEARTTELELAAAAKQSAKDKLATLGLTETEITAILGI